METIHAVILAFIASGGFWTLVQTLIVKRQDRSTAERQALLALLHDRIYTEAKIRIGNKRISAEDYDNLRYLYEPYKALGGNGTCERLMSEVDKLPIGEE